MDTRSDTGFWYIMLQSIQSFWIGVVESVNKLESSESMVKRGENATASLTGRPGMSILRMEGLALTRVRLGRNLSSNGGKCVYSAVKVKCVILDWLLRNR